jgi:hypothetical protein
MMGFFHGEERLRITPAAANDGSNRTEAARFEVR